MAYTAEISRRNPSCYVFMVDQSGSMAEPMPGSPRTKATFVADVINRTLYNITIQCTKSEAKPRDYFDVAVIGYGAQVGSILGGALQGQTLVPISEIATNPARVEDRRQKVDDGAGGIIEQNVKFPLWFDATANGGTPMRQATQIVNQLLTDWVGRHSEAFPPTVIHLTDGESTDGDPSEELRALANLATHDGNVLLFNVHVSSNPANNVLQFPSDTEQVPADPYARMLYDTASRLTAHHLSVANSAHQLGLADGAKAFVLNADASGVVAALDIGTKTDNKAMR